ncbi:MAG: thioesterase [Furfurilactobacillus sp.]|jgi:medium-chain acyl-[acyl-carrier-protein] hydrolase|uniref:Thioesterase n=1 Tax=Furfurilactobacillus milii TaxID=2888272 RepID=A0ABT6DB31_9LACO|nr:MULTISPECIES: acyl-ACP thioesterase domain-containing protein [Furfurilactobacillus]QLE67136.1 oleoyl-acyl-carrier protein thioesterase [Furfurilactobacillus rossiae]MCF6161491.1 acyl-ACP thioesterase [Furfurilactobacillus milii]MCF6163870.1 acyl-ACP thioesterase [Furfurilactobacillus milii]MCF6418854.1 acyl-ACP thioesterase [Furfurilactobacillus milii]MCH4011334.1 thioesterase [Furfurilactobacillus sp.]
MTQQNRYDEEHKIQYYETDLTGKVTLGMLINMLVLTSYDQADSFGVGTDYMLSKGYGWVIAQYEIDIKRLPRDHEKVRLVTEATSNNRYFAYRQFFLEDEQGNELVHVDTICVVMDLEARKMVAIPDDAVAPYHSEVVKRIPRLSRPTSFEQADVAATKTYRVRYFDLDSNHHVNNSHYFDWVMDALDEEFLIHHELCHLAIRFENEVRYGNTVKSEVTAPINNEDGTVTTHHHIMGDDERYAEATLTWRPLSATTVD